MARRIYIERYLASRDMIVGETMSISPKIINVFIYVERYGLVRPGSFLLIWSGDGGAISLVGSKVSKSKAGGEFIPLLWKYGDRAGKIFPDIDREYIYTVETHPLYEVDREGVLSPTFNLLSKPHQPVYLLYDEDVRNILGVDEVNLDFLQYIDMDDYILCRNLAYYLYKLYRGRMSLGELFQTFLSYAYRGGHSIDTVVNVFKEVGRHVR